MTSRLSIIKKNIDKVIAREHDYEEIYELFQSLRLASGVSVLTIAKDLGLPPSSLYAVDKGFYSFKPSLLKKISNYFEVPYEIFEKKFKQQLEKKQKRKQQVRSFHE